MLKKMTGILLIVLLMIIGTAGAQGSTVSTQEWSASVLKGAITVTFADGRENAVLTYEADESVTELLIAADYNFDGREDLAVLTSMGNVNSYYKVWLSTESGFEHCPMLDTIASPQADAATGRIKSFERGSAWAYSEASYIWQQNELKLFMQREITYQTDGSVAIEERMPMSDGMLIRQRTLTQEAWDAVQNMMATCEQMTEADPMVVCTYEGECVLQNEAYYVCAVRKNYEVLYVVYASQAEPSVLLIDRQADGMNEPLPYNQ